MNNSVQIIESWPREEVRLLTGFILIGFGLLFGRSFSLQFDTSFIACCAVYLLAGASLVMGAILVLFHPIVVIDPARRQVSKILMFCRMVAYRKTWGLDDCQCIEVHHKPDEGSYLFYISLKHSSGAQIWLRSFTSPKNEISEETASFIKDLEKTTGLRCEYS